MSKKTDVSTLRSRQNAGLRSQIQMRQRAMEQGGTPILKKTIIAQNLHDQKKLAAQTGRPAKNEEVVPTWEQQTGICDAISNGVVEFCEAVADNLRVVEAAGKADEMFNNIVKMAIKDCQVFTDKILQIKAKHQGKTGNVTVDELDVYYEIGSEYHNLFGQFQSVTMQAGIELTAYLSSIDESISKDKGLEQVVKTALEMYDPGTNPAEAVLEDLPPSSTKPN